MNLPKRKNIRLQGYDYSQAGCYFVTICTQNRQQLLSRIVVGGFHTAPLVELTPIGKEIQQIIKYLDNHYKGIKINKHTIMPNHVHLIIVLETGGHGNPPLQDVVGRLKSYSTKKYNEINKTQNRILWQRSYHDRIIRNEQEYQKIWEYIDTNPLKWEEDKYYPKRK